MNNKLVFYIGVVGVILFAITTIIGGFLHDNYSSLSQFISETYAIDTRYGVQLRLVGVIPSGILFTVFCLAIVKNFKGLALVKIGFYGLALFYGLATILVGIFPCDSGCNKELINPSTSQLIHNITGFLTYIFVPMLIVLIGFGLMQAQQFRKLSIQAFSIGLLSILGIAFLMSDSASNYLGLYQRVVEALFALWIFLSAHAIKN